MAPADAADGTSMAVRRGGGRKGNRAYARKGPNTTPASLDHLSDGQEYGQPPSESVLVST